MMEAASRGEGPINLADRIELRRFVGREFLLWLWLESELFEATLATKEHGSFGLWLEGRLVLDEGPEVTTIKGRLPGHHREAKESLLRGKTPERAGLHVSFADHECTLTLRGETLAFTGLVPPKKVKAEAPALEEPKRVRKKASPDVAADADESFYERMSFARDVEGLVTALYRDFLNLRLSSTWDAKVVPVLEAWAAGDEIDVEGYRSTRSRVLAPRTKRPHRDS